ncbi:PREDICTED: uncharacterized protein LOC109233132 [Nicotiana attenuata]|uniref:uncharacterized protein LOC109233132 n=1 Tax=Nicotiana attenuata TaxID=49451 RepID=UPI00090471D1|nr:PREDICTED: uncharacterized protein LOC109233132 [Nicotiana attenuata]
MSQRNGKIPFKFFNVWADHSVFGATVARVWSHKLAEDPMKNIWLKLKKLRPVLKKINAEEFKGISHQIENTRKELRMIQEKLTKRYSDDLLEVEKNTILKLEKWSLIEKSVMKQKSRVKWIQLGDSNTKYISAVLKERSQRKQIVELNSIAGNKLTDTTEIKEEIINFYKGLMGTTAQTLPAINKQVMKTGPVLSHAQQIFLCKEVTDKEIYECLSSIGDDKSPGVDGYNAYFFKKSWNIVRTYLCEAVKNFFATGRLHRSINCTAITLIPKTACPNSGKIFDLLHVLVCFIMYCKDPSSKDSIDHRGHYL